MRRVEKRWGKSKAYSPASETAPHLSSSPATGRTYWLWQYQHPSRIYTARPSDSRGDESLDSYRTHLTSPRSVRTARLTCFVRDSRWMAGRHPWTNIASVTKQNPAPTARDLIDLIAAVAPRPPVARVSPSAGCTPRATCRYPSRSR